jgi:hypothetical protein
MAHQKNPAAVALGRLGGVARARALTSKQISDISRKAGTVGGRIRAEKLTPARRRAIAQKAGIAGASARWGKKKG